MAAAIGNSTPVDGFDFSGVADVGRQMSAYDRLPLAVRRALDDAPYEICCVALLNFYKERGEAAALKAVEISTREFLKAAERERKLSCHLQ